LKRVVLGLLFLVLFFRLEGNYSNKGVSPSGQMASEVSAGLPVRLKIPSINIDAGVQYLGVNSKGEMEVPSNIVDVGWFELGPKPGEKGSAVIAGHFNGESGEAGIFAELYKLKSGDRVEVEDEKGIKTIFVVRESRIYNPGYADEVFGSNDNVHLNLITCDGYWDGTKKSFSKRLVVFTDRELDK